MLTGIFWEKLLTRNKSVHSFHMPFVSTYSRPGAGNRSEVCLVEEALQGQGLAEAGLVGGFQTSEQRCPRCFGKMSFVNQQSKQAKEALFQCP